jgi:hypothetical protein
MALTIARAIDVPENELGANVPAMALLVFVPETPSFYSALLCSMHGLKNLSSCAQYQQYFVV